MDTLTWLLSIVKEEQAYKTEPQKSMTNDAKVQDVHKRSLKVNLDLLVD